MDWYMLPILPGFKLKSAIVIHYMHVWGVGRGIKLICLFSLYSAKLQKQYVIDPHKILDFETAAKIWWCLFPPSANYCLLITLQTSVPFLPCLCAIETKHLEIILLGFFDSETEAGHSGTQAGKTQDPWKFQEVPIQLSLLLDTPQLLWLVMPYANNTQPLKSSLS